MTQTHAQIKPGEYECCSKNVVAGQMLHCSQNECSSVPALLTCFTPNFLNTLSSSHDLTPIDALVSVPITKTWSSLHARTQLSRSAKYRSRTASAAHPTGEYADPNHIHASLLPGLYCLRTQNDRRASRHMSAPALHGLRFLRTDATLNKKELGLLGHRLPCYPHLL